MMRALLRLAAATGALLRRVVPFAVLGGATAFLGFLAFDVLPFGAPGLVAKASVATVLLRAAVQLAAICAGVFALAAIARDRAGMPATLRRRWRSLREIGALGVTTGSLGLFGGLIGIDIARSGAGVAFTAACGALAAWGTWSLTRRTRARVDDTTRSERLLDAAARADEWIANRAVRVPTPVP